MAFICSSLVLVPIPGVLVILWFILDLNRSDFFSSAVPFLHVPDMVIFRCYRQARTGNPGAT